MLMLTTDASLEEVVKVLNGQLAEAGFERIEKVERSGIAYTCEDYYMGLFPVDEFSREYYFELFGKKFVLNPKTEIWGECLAGLGQGSAGRLLKRDFKNFEKMLIDKKYSVHVWDFKE